MKNRNNPNNIYSMEGIGKVFRFTLSQTFKNKGYLFSYILLIVMMSVTGPLSMLSASASEKAVQSTDSMNEENELSELMIINEISGTELSKEDFSELADTAFGKAEMTVTNDENAVVPELTDTQICMIIKHESGEDNAEQYTVQGVITDESKIKPLQLESLTEKIRDIFEAKRRGELLSDEQYALISAGISTGKAVSEKDYFDKLDQKIPSSEITIYSTVYSIIVMILVSLTVSYVITAVMEEKTSKLVENLLVSVRPLALIMGKISAMMIYVVSMLLFGGIGASISTAITSFFNKSEVAAEMGEHMSVNALYGLAIWKILILLLSLVITYLMFSIIAGIMGSACTKVEEVGPTVMIINFLSIAGYASAVVIPIVDNKILYYIFSVVPFISSYVGPVSFICGRTPFWIYLISLAVQILFVMWLFRLCAKVYRKLIVNDSKKLSLFEIIKLSREEEVQNV